MRSINGWVSVESRGNPVILSCYALHERVSRMGGLSLDVDQTNLRSAVIRIHGETSQLTPMDITRMASESGLRIVSASMTATFGDVGATFSLRSGSWRVSTRPITDDDERLLGQACTDHDADERLNIALQSIN